MLVEFVRLKIGDEFLVADFAIRVDAAAAKLRRRHNLPPNDVDFVILAIFAFTHNQLLTKCEL